MCVHVGSPAPEFTVKAYVRGLSQPRTITLAALRGRWIVLSFYPRDFAHQCPDELRALARLRREFAHAGAVVLGASTDSYLSHKAWFEGDARLGDVRFPIVADTTGALCAAFGTLLPGGAVLPGTFAIDPAGIVRYRRVDNRDAGWTVAHLLHFIRALQATDPAFARADAATHIPEPYAAAAT